LIIVFFCSCTIIRLFQLWPDPLAKGDISAALLKKSDSPLFQNTTRITSQHCNKFLELESALEENVRRCDQVQLARPDYSLQLLNAAWEYESVTSAEEAARHASELPEMDRSIVLDVPEMPPIGSYSVVMSATINTPNGEIYLRNIHWTHKNVLLRLTVIGRETMSVEDLYSLALLIEGRLP
jgi:hypothetical protein